MGFKLRIAKWFRRRFYQLAQYASSKNEVVDVYPQVRVKPFDELLQVALFEANVRCEVGNESYDESAYSATSLLGPPLVYYTEKAENKASRLAAELESMGLKTRLHPLTFVKRT